MGNCVEAMLEAIASHLYYSGCFATDFIKGHINYHAETNHARLLHAHEMDSFLFVEPKDLSQQTVQGECCQVLKLLAKQPLGSLKTITNGMVAANKLLRIVQD